MRKKIGFKYALLSLSTLDGEELEPRLKNLIREYMDAMRFCDSSDALDLAVFMTYCSYISRNADDLGLRAFDSGYSVDGVIEALGNKYLASDFVEYYAGVCTQNASFPDLRGIELHARDLSKAISNWAEMLEASGLSFMENSECKTATVIWNVLANLLASDSWGRRGGEVSSRLPIADLVTRLADVEGKSVLDFACGNGIYLSTSLSKGASAVFGRDVNAQATMRARILCFFADTSKAHDIAIASALSVASGSSPVQRVLVAPPLGIRLIDSDIQEKEYCADTMATLMGDVARPPATMEDFCVAKALASLTDDGMAVLHVSASFLFHQQKSRQMLRQSLVEGGYLKAVIELPGGCILNTGIKSALLVIAKEPPKDGVFIVDFDSKELADKGYVRKGRGHCEITEAGISWLVELVDKHSEIPFVSTVVSRDAILASGSNLCYSTYGDVFDSESFLDKTRSSVDIKKDIQAAQTNIKELGAQIADILNAIEKEG